MDDTGRSRGIAPRWNRLGHVMGMAEWDAIRKDAAAPTRVSNEYNNNIALATTTIDEHAIAFCIVCA